MQGQRPLSLGAIQAATNFAVKKSKEAGDQAAEMLREHREMLKVIGDMQKTIASLQSTRSGSNAGIQYIENIPGRRIPFDYLVDIPIGADITSVQQGTITIDQDGPFVAVQRYATFVSQYGFQRTDPIDGAIANFTGRSFGRYRPIHSAWDLNDGQPPSEVVKAVAFPGTGAPYVASVSNASPWRSMQPDFRIKFLNGGSGFPRSNIEVPSSFWTKQINSPFNLGALDFFARGETLQFNVLPLHANNAPFGNVSGFGAPNANYPFIDSQWDRVEGINDQNDANANDVDPITRAPQGILTIGFHGFKIIQQPGAGYT